MDGRKVEVSVVRRMRLLEEFCSECFAFRRREGWRLLFLSGHRRWGGGVKGEGSRVKGAFALLCCAVCYCCAMLLLPDKLRSPYLPSSALLSSIIIRGSRPTYFVRQIVTVDLSSGLMGSDSEL